MNYKNLTKKSEDLKRRWLEDICKEYPSHTLTYVPMLTDKKAGKAAVVAKEQREEIVESFLTDMSERVTNKVKVYGQSNIYKKDPLEQMDYFRYMLEEHKLDAREKEIFFIDPDSGFYEDGIVSRVGETDDKKHISMPHIKLLLFNIENPPPRPSTPPPPPNPLPTCVRYFSLPLAPQPCSAPPSLEALLAAVRTHPSKPKRMVFNHPPTSAVLVCPTLRCTKTLIHWVQAPPSR